MSTPGYYRFPTIWKDQIVFVSEDDLWKVTLTSPKAERLTATKGAITRPHFSPDGKWLAFSATEEGHTEIYLMPSEGGEPKRLTYLGAISKVVGWSPDGKILFTSNGKSPSPRIFLLYSLSPEGGIPVQLPVGPANHISFGSQNRSVLGRNTGEPAYWKRYRGGRVGVLWVDNQGNGEYTKLVHLDGNLTSPLWIGERIYFISDHEKVGALYSCNPEGKDLERLTPPMEFYVRNASTDGNTIVFHSGGDLFLFNPQSKEMEKIEIEYHSFRPQRSRKFVSPSKFLEEYSLHPKGHSLSLVVRGKPFSMANWEEGVLRYGDLHGVRYRLTQWMSDGRHLISLSDKGGEEGIEIFDTHLEEEPKRLELNIGRPLNMKVSPVKDEILISNHRQELLLVDLKRKKTTLIDQSPYARFEGFDWSSDGRWIVYSKSGTPKTFSLYLYHLESKKIYPLTSPRFRDVQPYFDVEGKYIYFLSYREFNPVYDSHYFDLGFPKGGKPYLIVLRNNLPNPFEPLPKSPDEKVEEGKDSKKPGPTKVEIDLEGIEKRILPFPVPERRYQQIEGAKGKVLFSYEPVEGSFEKSWMAKNGEGNQILEYFDFDLQKTEILARGINDFKVAMDSNVVVYRSGSRLRVLPIRPEDSGKTKDPTPSRESGWIDLERVKVEVDPLMEWKQMFREIWRLQRDHFWSPDMCGLDWDKVYHRYEPLLERLSTRSEFSDLIWEMQGELGTSHAYELGGDYRQPPAYYQGFLGADFKYNEEKGGYEILHIIEGDPWSLTFSSPLIHPGAGVSKGDVLLAIDGQYLDKETPPEKLLVHKRKERVQLLIETKEGRKRISVCTLDSEFPCRYREWVEKNRSYVLEATKGRVGYLHIPNMGPFGFAEFHRYFLHEVEKDGLIVDVRYNGGGHVSQLILEKLARKRIGYDISRWGQPDPYPSDSLLGPIVAITNEDAGSDGDIFSHCFKLYKLGTLVGKRTWGGVIGIWPRHFLVDGSITTQPEFSFWFVDVGFGVENYGTDPDVEVENTPMDWRDGKDRQLDKAIEIILSQLEANPPKLPEFSPKPRLEVP